MNHADLYCSVTPSNFAPTVMAADEKDQDDSHINRFAKIGQISPLRIFQAYGGIPVH